MLLCFGRNTTGLRSAAVRTLVAVVFLGFELVTGQAQTNAPTAAAVAPAKTPWERIVMIGASVTAGFTASEPFGGTNTQRLRLSRYVEAALLTPHEPVQNLGNGFLFLQPLPLAQQQVAQAKQGTPSLVIGLDFLFWFCYGEGATDEERLQRFEQGLKLLEGFQCPLVVGDLPDASAAVNRMLRPDQIPSAKALAAANQRLAVWSKAQRNVALVPLAEFMRNVVGNHAIKLRDYTLPEGQTRLLLQDDNLHASFPGCAVLAMAVLDAAASTRPTETPPAYRRDPKEIYRLALKPTPAEAARTNGNAVTNRVAK